MIKRVSKYASIMYTATRSKQLTCDNCFEYHLLFQMSNGTKCCIDCAKDVEELTSRIPHHNERD